VVPAPDPAPPPFDGPSGRPDPPRIVRVEDRAPDQRPGKARDRLRQPVEVVLRAGHVLVEEEDGPVSPLEGARDAEDDAARPPRRRRGPDHLDAGELAGQLPARRAPLVVDEEDPLRPRREERRQRPARGLRAAEGRDDDGGGLRQTLSAGRSRAALSASTMILTSSSNVVFGAHPSSRRAFDASPRVSEMSRGRRKRGSRTT